MATIVFSGGNELVVSDSVDALVQRIAAAERGERVMIQYPNGQSNLQAGWFNVTIESGSMLPVRPGAVAYVRP
jgi:hypothetical protein